jgi:hypothetical protein
MRTADQITSFLNNEMTASQEREFLLSVAASDSLRLALKSHVMLDRIFTGQLERVHVPDAVRETIFSEMRASLAEPLSVPSGTAPAAYAMSQAGSSLYSRLASRAGWTLMIVLLTLGGFTAGYYAGTGLSVKKGPEVTTVTFPNTPRDLRRDPPGPSSSLSSQTPATSLSTAAPASEKPRVERAVAQETRMSPVVRKVSRTTAAQSANLPSADIAVPKPSVQQSESAKTDPLKEVRNPEPSSTKNGVATSDEGTKMGIEVVPKIRKPNDSDRSTQQP